MKTNEDRRTNVQGRYEESRFLLRNWNYDGYKFAWKIGMATTSVFRDKTTWILKREQREITISDLRGKFEMVTSSEFRDILKIKILLLRFQILEGRWNLYMKNHDSRNTRFRDTAQKRGVYEAESKLCESTRPYSLVGMFWECMKKKQEHRNTVGARPGRTKSPQIKDTGDAQTMGPGARSVQQRKTNYEPRSSGLKNHGLPSMKARLKSGGSSGRGNHGCVGKVRKSKKQTAGEQC